MKLVDDVTIIVKAGNGGNGAVAKRQLYGSKKTIPDGGNGGNGGSVYFKADRNVFDLSEFRFRKKIQGTDGVDGGKKNKDGKNGDNIIVFVPYGTTIKNLTTGQYVELVNDISLCVAYGGRGGVGNHDYNPSIQKFNPRLFEGEKGDEFKLQLILNIIADVGLVGLPNSGKSSLLKALTNANPKIGNYEFTTLSPNLGMIKSKVIADIPGLIKGSTIGKGLGISFLKHIQKTTTLLHCIDATKDDPIASYNIIREEFAGFDKNLLQKKEIILLTKIDLVSVHKKLDSIRKLKKTKKQVVPVSVYDKDSIKKLKDTISNL